jgi:hypothetical protein
MGRSMVSALHLAQVPQVVFQHPLLDGHLGRHVQVLHLAAAAGPGVQAEVRAAGAHALGRFAVDGRQAGLFPVVLLAVGVGADQLGGQGAIDEHHLAVGLAGHALGIQVQGLHQQPGRQGGRGPRSVPEGVSGDWSFGFAHAPDCLRPCGTGLGFGDGAALGLAQGKAHLGRVSGSLLTGEHHSPGCPARTPTFRPAPPGAGSGAVARTCRPAAL